MGEAKRILKVEKRSGEIIPFDKEKITGAIFKAAQAAGGEDRTLAEQLMEKVVEEISILEDNIPTVEQVQDCVEKILIKEGHAKTAKQYILYRAQRQKEREQRTSIIGQVEEIKVDLAGAMVAKKRYLQKRQDGSPENIKYMFLRVAKEIAKAERKYENDPKEYQQKFYEMMKNLEFLPGGRILANAGNKERFLMNSFVLPVEDKTDLIFETLKRAIIIQKGGGGTGFDFSRIRPRGSITEQTESSAAGPLVFIELFNSASRAIKNRGNRQGANMGILRVDHPQILDFITMKDKIQLNHFNISVGITDEFMDAVSKNQDYPIIDPLSKKEIERIKARRVLDLITTMAWKTADPGVLFLDKINASNPTSHLGIISAPDTCGEMPMHDNESVPLGSIKVNEDKKEKELDFEKLKDRVNLAIRFLDDVIDVSWYPFKDIEEMSKGNRRIGLGIMGWADTLYELKIPYNSNKAISLAKEVMGFINKEADITSQQLAKERGVFPNYKGSKYDKEGRKRRNAVVTAIAPTGSISILAGVSSSIEPNFALSTMRQMFTTEQVLIVNKAFEKTLIEKDMFSEQLMKDVAEKGSIKDIDNIPDQLKEIFVVAHQIEPKWHLRMQAAFQENVEGAISKTINFPADASLQDVYEAFTEAYKLNLKGISVYRNNSKENQVLQNAY
jgi:ribonucleoside-diphosphate reductase alpha chain